MVSNRVHIAERAYQVEIHNREHAGGKALASRGLVQPIKAEIDPIPLSPQIGNKHAHWRSHSKVALYAVVRLLRVRGHWKIYAAMSANGRQKRTFDPPCSVACHSANPTASVTTDKKILILQQVFIRADADTAPVVGATQLREGRAVMIKY